MDAPPVQYVKTSDGCHIAYTVSGEGLPLVYLPGHFHHVQLSWRSPAYGPWLEALARRFRLVDYDGRGLGMSTRGLVNGLTADQCLLDLEAVLDRTTREPAVLLAGHSMSHIGVRYALEHPNRVKALVFPEGYVSGSEVPILSTLVEIARHGWDAFLELGLPAIDMNADERKMSIERARQSETADDFLAIAEAFTSWDSVELLPQLTTPSLVLHVRDNTWVSLAACTRMAALIPGATIRIIDGAGMSGDADQAMAAIEGFLAGLPAEDGSTEPLERQATESLGDSARILSPREVEVLRLLAAGKSNQQIADELVISLNTVRRHVSNIFDKTGVANRAQAAVYARDHSLA